jgi:hypothetical protein
VSAFFEVAKLSPFALRPAAINQVINLQVLRISKPCRQQLRPILLRFPAVAHINKGQMLRSQRAEGDKNRKPTYFIKMTISIISA